MVNDDIRNLGDAHFDVDVGDIVDEHVVDNDVDGDNEIHTFCNVAYLVDDGSVDNRAGGGVKGGDIGDNAVGDTIDDLGGDVGDDHARSDIVDDSSTGIGNNIILILMVLMIAEMGMMTIFRTTIALISTVLMMTPTMTLII